jgi:hypothetical protein
MPASIYYMRDHYRDRPDPIGRRSRPAPPRVRARSNLGFMLGILAFIVALVMLGVWLTDGVASVGRSNNQCLTSARRVCGVFPSEHALWGEGGFRVGLRSADARGA